LSLDAFIVGNGPSAKDVKAEKLDGVVYGCNAAGAERGCAHVFCADPWGQYDIIKSGYSGQMHFTRFKPVPCDVALDQVVDTGYDFVIHNEEQRAESSNFLIYSTGDSDVEAQFGTSGYWRRRRSYICFVPDSLKIQDLPLLKLESMDRPPSGAFALNYALSQDHEKIIIMGFDSIFGEYSGSWDMRNEPYNSERQIFDKWGGVYDEIIGDREVEWRR
tara:strand:+ start:102 stop:755 length:654 start_codon:yes stop_codon:yes gene_type:complete